MTQVPLLRALSLIVWLGVSGCASGYYSGQLSLERAARGDVFIDMVELGGGHEMVRAVALLPAPPWRVIALLADYANIPLWNTAVDRVTITKDEGEFGEVRIEFRRGVMQMPMLEQRVHLDPTNNEVTLVAYENEKIKSMETIIKLEPFGAGEQALLNIYMSAETKMAVPMIGAMQRDRAVNIVENLRRAVLLPRYAVRPTFSTPKKRAKLAMPAFKAAPNDAALARAATRLVAERLMRDGVWHVVTQDEVVALLNYAGQQQLVGCSTGKDCVTDVARTLAADYILNGEIAHVGKAFVMSAVLLRIKDGTVLARSSADAPDEAALLERIKTSVADLSGSKP